LIILGIDPGINTTGYGIIRTLQNDEMKIVECGIISSPAKLEHSSRLKYIYDRLIDIIERQKPDVVAIENLFHNKNLKSLVDVSEAIGVITLAAANFNIRIEKFSPLKVKSAIVGFGRAEKEQVGMMIQNLLDLEVPPESHHISDALAVAVCYRNLHC